jgi:hypothetical protein
MTRRMLWFLIAQIPLFGLGSAAARAAEAPSIARFVPNVGQFEPSVKFMSPGTSRSLLVTDQGLVMVLSTERSDPAHPLTPSFTRGRVSMNLAGGRAVSGIEGLDRLPGLESFRVGMDPRRWRSDVSSFARVRMAGVYPGIDLVLHGAARGLEYDFIVAPGADPGTVRLRFSGADRMLIQADGALSLETPAGVVRHEAPVAYQGEGEGRRTVPARFRRLSDGNIGFVLGAYDHRQALVIDPVVVSTVPYQGFDSANQTTCIATDAAGQWYAGGSYTNSDGTRDFTVNTDGPQGAYQWSGGGSGDDFINAITVSPTGQWYAGGQTNGIVPLFNAFDTTFIGNNVWQGFIYASTRGGGGFQYASYLGTRSHVTSTDGDSMTITGIAARSDREIWLTGPTLGNQMPFTPNGFQRTNNGDVDAFVMKIDPTRTPTSQVQYFSYYGGASADYSTGIALVPANRGSGVKIVGHSSSPDLRVSKSHGPVSRAMGVADVFILRSSGASFYEGAVSIGGSGADMASAIAFDTAGNTYVTGHTASTDFPTMAATQAAFGGGSADLFVTKLNFSDTTLQYSTYLGGVGRDSDPVMAVTGNGVVQLAGRTTSSNFPTTGGAIQTALQGGTDVALVRLNVAGRRVFSSYFGSTGDDLPGAIITVGPTLLLATNSNSPTLPGLSGPHLNQMNTFITRLKASALLVVGNSILDSGDAAIRDRLTTLGFAVTIKTGLAVTTADAVGMDLVLVSATITSGDVNTKFKASFTPVIMCENALQDDMAMTSATAGQFGNAANQGTLTMITSTDPLSAGLSGTPAVTTPGSAFAWGKPSANAVSIASLPSDATRIAIYRYEAGASMVGLVAPDRRVGLFTGDEPIAGDEAAAKLTASGAAVFDAAVKWAAGL